MPTDLTDAAFAAVRAADPDVMDRDELAVHVEHLRTVRAWIDAAEVRAARRTRVLAAAGCAESAASMATRIGKRSSKEARTVADRSAVCDDMPVFQSALQSGAISAGHVDAVASAARTLDDTGMATLIGFADELVDQASRTDVDTFARAMRDTARTIATCAADSSDADELDAQRRRSTVKRWVDQHTGMHHTHLELDPLRDARMWTAINAQLATERTVDGNRRTPWSQLQVDAVVNAVAERGASPSNHGDRGNRGDRLRPEIGVLVDWRTLADGAHSAGVCETDAGVPLPVSTVRRMCCDADVFPVVLGGAGEVLDAGRSRRTATRPQRRALRAMHRSCAHPDCTVGIDACRIHHVRWWWEHRGPTDIDNLLPLCETHHHQVHEGGWTLSMTSARIATWTRPDGAHYWTGSTIDRKLRAAG